MPTNFTTDARPRLAQAPSAAAGPGGAVPNVPPDAAAPPSADRTPLVGTDLSGVAGAIACALGLALLVWPSLLAATFGIEAIALGFWLWARAASDARAQIPRWGWLRRPAAAMWIAVAVHAVAPQLMHPIRIGSPVPPALAWLEAAAVLWAGLELVAALPLARGYSDLPGPFPPARAFIPLVLPAAGFLLLWRQEAHWTEFGFVRDAAIVLLVFTAFLGALRAFARRGITASLRWMAISQSALAAVILAGDVPATTAALVLWLSSFGAAAILLTGESAGSVTRRGVTAARLWRAAGGVSVAAVGWPAMMAVNGLEPAGLRLACHSLGAVAIAMSTWLFVARVEVAPERRQVVRQGEGSLVVRIGAAAVLTGTVAGLALAWWNGFEPPWSASVLALAPAFAGALAAFARKERQVPLLAAIARRGADGIRPLASSVFVLVVRVERWIVGALVAMARFVIAPLRDLHTGDAQEYLLFLVGIGILGLLLPLLR